MSERLDLTKKSEKEHNCPLTWEEMDQNWTDIEKVTGDLGDSVDSINNSIEDINDSLKDINDRLDNIGEEGSVDLSSIKARVADVQNVPVATATVKVENNDTLAFSFGFQKGKDGKDGADGKDGIPGDDGLTSTTIFVFKSSEVKPARPVGGSWTLEGFIPPEGWNDSSDELDGIIWQSYAVFLETGAIIKDWSEPVRITGNDGKNGVDGNSLEFIYKLTVNDYETPQKPISENTDDYVPSGWTDSPSGISSEYQVEWMCQREKTNGIWEDFTTPVIWSKWGADGRDGDGVEYVYKKTNTAIPPEKPTDGEVNEDEELIPEGWTDNPTGVDHEYQWEWVSQRKYKNGVWSDFSNPALWAKYGEQGQSGYSVRIMYTKTDNSSIEPSFDASNINPGSLWGLIIPEHSGTEAVWGIQGTVTYDNQLVGKWTGPYLITGVAGQDGTTPNYKTFVFKNSDGQPAAPTGDSVTPGDGWVDYPSGTGTWWMSVGEVNGTTGLVTSWSTPIRVNGKDGAGAVSIESISEEYGISKSYSTQPDSWEQSPVAPTEEYPYAWNREIIHYSDSSTQDFTRVYATYTQDGRGITSVVNYYKLTESNTAPTIDESWSTVPTLPTDETPYLWGFERITYTDGFTEDSTVHIITIKSKDGVSISNIKEQYGLSDGLSIQPSQWFDTPQTPTEENSFAWNKEIIEYDNGTSHELTPRIYAQYVTNGRGISSIQNYYKLTSTDTPPSIEDDDWGTIVQVPNETDKYLWNYEVITYTDSDTYSTQVVLLGTYAKDGGFYDLVGEEYGLSNSTDTPPTSWSSSIALPTESQRYGWIREEVVDTEGEHKYTTPRIYIWFTQDGLNGVGIESVVNLYRTATEEGWNIYKDYTGKVSKVGYQYFLAKGGVSAGSIELFTAPQDPTSEFPILFGVEFITYTDGTTHNSPPHIISRYTESGADAPYTELRFKDYPAENISVSLTEEEKHERNISGWSVNMSELASGQARWMISGVINPGEQLSEDGWQGPVRVSGEKGPQGDTGPAGSNGVSGLPGITYRTLYSLGNDIRNPNNVTITNSQTVLTSSLGYYLWNKYKDVVDLTSVGIQGSDEGLPEIAQDYMIAILEAVSNYNGNPNSNTLAGVLTCYYFYSLLIWNESVDFYSADKVPETLDKIKGELSSLKEIDTYYEGAKEIAQPLLIANIETLNPYIICTQARMIRQTTEDGYSWQFDGDTQWSKPFFLTGVSGLNGTNGTGVSSIKDYYMLTATSSTPTFSTSTATTTPQNPTEELPYLWVCDLVTYSDGTSSWTGTPRLLSTWSEGNKVVTSIITTYGVSTSSTTPPSSFSTNYQFPSEGQYLWTRVTLNFSDGTSTYTDNVSKGISGAIINTISDEYAVITDGSEPTSSSWSPTYEIPDGTTIYKIWNREVFTYTDGTIFRTEGRVIYECDDDSVTTATVNGVPLKINNYEIDRIENYYCVTKTDDTPKSTDTTGTNSNILVGWVLDGNTGLDWYSVLRKTLNRNAPYLWAYERTYLKAHPEGTYYPSKPRLIQTYTPTGSGTVNLYYVDHLCSDLSAPTNSYGYYLMNNLWYLARKNPNRQDLTYSQVLKNATKEDLIAVGILDEGSTDEDYQNYLDSITTENDNNIDSFNEDMIFIDSEGVTHTGTDSAIWQISARLVIHNDNTREFATGVTQWSEPICINAKGEQGENGTGVTSIVVNYGLSTSNTSYSSVTDWQSSMPSTTSSKPYIWVRTQYYSNSSIISTTYNLYTEGKGIAEIINYYMLSSSNSGITSSSSGWSTTVPTPTASMPYLWNYERVNYTDGTYYNSTAHIICILSEGSEGTRGQLVYPAGVYSVSTSYTTDASKAPYVLDTTDGNYYVLNAQMTWLGTQQSNRTPSQDYSVNKGAYWQLLEHFDALFANIAVVANGMIGSAVFNGDYMFSQYGYNSSGNLTTNYQNFNTGVFTTKYTSGYSFFPAFAVNLRSGGIYIFGQNPISSQRTQIPIVYKKILPSYEDKGVLYASSSYYNSSTYPARRELSNGSYRVYLQANQKKFHEIHNDQGEFHIYGWAEGLIGELLIENIGAGGYYACKEVTAITVLGQDMGLYSDSIYDGTAAVLFNGNLYNLHSSNLTSYSSVSSWLSHLGLNY